MEVVEASMKVSGRSIGFNEIETSMEVVDTR